MAINEGVEQLKELATRYSEHEDFLAGNLPNYRAFEYLGYGRKQVSEEPGHRNFRAYATGHILDSRELDYSHMLDFAITHAAADFNENEIKVGSISIKAGEIGISVTPKPEKQSDIDMLEFASEALGAWVANSLADTIDHQHLLKVNAQSGQLKSVPLLLRPPSLQDIAPITAFLSDMRNHDSFYIDVDGESDGTISVYDVEPINGTPVLVPRSR